MKKFIYLIMGLGLLITGCNPMDDIHSDIDSQKNPVVGDAIITLTDEDYDALDLSYGSFSSLDDAKNMLPDYLSSLYPVWGKGSSITAGFKLYVGNAPGLSNYTGATVYTLSNADYPGASNNAIAFFPNENPSSFIDDLLASKISNPSENQNVLVKYKQYVGEPVLGISNYFDADFKTAKTLLDFDAINVVGDQVWVETTGYGAKMSGYLSGAKPNEDWLISKEIDLTSQTNISFQINQALNFASGRLDLINILVSTDYNPDNGPATATWDTINLTTKPAGTNWTFVMSEDYDFSAYEGKKIHIAFKYESTDTVAATWEVARAIIKTPGVEGETVNNAVYYTYVNGVWKISTGVYYLSAADFDSMGTASGQPGQYNNFSSSIAPNDYLPTFLKLKYPYALEGDALFVIYAYYSGGAQTRGNLYTVVDGQWTAYQSTQETSLQFAHDGVTWVPDNTIKYEFLKTDYDYIVATFENTDGYANAVGNLKSYGNISTFNWTVPQIDAAINAVLMHNYPGMEVGQKFSVTIYVYDGTSHNSTINYILQGGTYIRS
jgi:hypothetical protein